MKAKKAAGPGNKLSGKQGKGVAGKRVPASALTSVVLVEPNNSGNVGAVARAMANFGFSGLILVKPRCRIDSAARNRAKHAQHILDSAKTVKSLRQALKGKSIAVGTTGVPCTDYNVLRSPIPVREAASRLANVNGKIALVFGREDYGLYNEEVELMDFMVTIPSDKKYPILNLSHAVSIALYEFSSQLHEKDINEGHPLASPADKARLLRLVNQLVRKAGFPAASQNETQRLVWKRVIGKSLVTKREAFAMMGFLKRLKKSK